MFLKQEDLPFFFVMSTIILPTIFVFVWILWMASTYLVNNILFNTGYIDDQVPLLSNDTDTDQEEMTVFTIESQ